MYGQVWEGVHSSESLGTVAHCALHPRPARYSHPPRSWQGAGRGMLGARAHTSTATGPYMSTRTRTNTGTRHHTVGHRTAHPRVSLSHNMGVLPFPQQHPV